MDTMSGESVPSLAPGITWMVDESDRSTAPHQLVLAQLEIERGRVFWIDARDLASTYALYAIATTPRTLDPIRIARAWTAHQHHTLVQRTVDRASHRTRLLVVPHVCSLYRDDDLDTHEADRLLTSSLRTLSALAEALAVPVLVTAPAQERPHLEPIVDHELECEPTQYGYAFTGESFRTTVFQNHGWWQTTIPYWVELLGAEPSDVDIVHEVSTGLETFA